MFNRSNGYNVLIDELVPPEKIWSKAPRYISIALTNACDLNCPFCYAPKHPASLNYDILTKWLIELDNNGCLGVGFGGGEPTLYKGFSKLCNFLARKTELAVSLTTHGHRLTNSLLKDLKHNVNFIRISMDGINARYEAIRECSFQSFLEILTKLQRDFLFGINYVVNSDTIGDLNKAIEIAEKFSASEFLLLPEVGYGRGKEIDELTYKKLKKWVSSYTGKIPLTISENQVEGMDVCNPFKDGENLSSYAHIDATGILKYNSYDEKGEKINTQSLISALENLKNNKKVMLQ